MGFDNECILNIQSLAGEYFCPVCRLLIYPNEAIQSQCTHLYCKPCLMYIVSTTRACPYDGYLVTETDSKPLVESNKILAETIGKIAVHCLYHRSGCTWQGSLSDCTSHCSGCAFGNSPVVCNRCGVQIVHRQVQEHAQNCAGVQQPAPQVQGAQEGISSGNVGTAANIQTVKGETASQPQTSQATIGPTQEANQLAASQVQSVSQSAVPTPEQWYQQQRYLQYYQQYPGYDPYQQQYQQYYPYQQAVQQYQQPNSQAQVPFISGQTPVQTYGQPPPQLQVQSQAQFQQQSQPQMQPNASGQPPAQGQAPVPAQHLTQGAANQHQVYSVMQHHYQAAAQANQQPISQLAHGQQYSQVQPQLQPQNAQNPQVPPYHQPQSQTQHPHPTIQVQPSSHMAQHHSAPQYAPSSQQSQQTVVQQPSQLNAQPRPIIQPNQASNPSIQSQHPSAPTVSGHHSYPQPQSYQQIHVGGVQHPGHMQPSQTGNYVQTQHSMVHGQLPQQASQIHPMQPASFAQNTQQASLLPSPGVGPSMPQHQQQGYPHPQQPINSLQSHPVMPSMQQPLPAHSMQQQQPVIAGQPTGIGQNMSHTRGHFVQQQHQGPVQSQLRPPGPAQSLQQLPPPPHAQHNAAIAHGRPGVPNLGSQSQLLPQSYGSQNAILSGHVQFHSGNSYGIANHDSATNNLVHSSEPSGHIQYLNREHSTTTMPNMSEMKADHISGKISAGQVVEDASRKTGGKGSSASAVASGSEVPLVDIGGSKSDSISKTADNNHKSSIEEIKSMDGTEHVNGGNESHAAVSASEDLRAVHTLKQENNSNEVETSALEKSIVGNDKKDNANTTCKQSEGSSLKNAEVLDVVATESHMDQQEGFVENDTAKLQIGNNSQVPAALTSSTIVSSQSVPVQSLIASHGPAVNCPHVLDRGFEQPPNCIPQHQQLTNNGSFSLGERCDKPLVFRDVPRGPLNRIPIQGHAAPQLIPQGPSVMGSHGQSFLPREHFQDPLQKQPHAPFLSDTPRGGFPPAGSAVSFGRSADARGFESGNVGPYGYHGQANLPPPPATGFPAAGSAVSFGMSADRVGVDARSFEPNNFGPHGYHGQANVPPPAGGYFYPRPYGPSTLDHVESHQNHSLWQSSGVPSNTMTTDVHLAGSSSMTGIENERFKHLRGANVSAFPFESSNHVFDNKEYDESRKLHGHPYHDIKSVINGGSYISHVKSFDQRCLDGSSMDAHVRHFDKGRIGVSYDGKSNLGTDISCGPSKIFPPPYADRSLQDDRGERELPVERRDDMFGRRDIHAHPDLDNKVSGFSRHGDEGPFGGYTGFPSRGFGGFSSLPGDHSTLDNTADKKELLRFNDAAHPSLLSADPLGRSFPEGRFSGRPSLLYRSEYERDERDTLGPPLGPVRNVDPFHPDTMPSRSEFLGPRNVPGKWHFGEGTDIDIHKSNVQMGESVLGHPPFGDVGYRSSFSIPKYQSDGGFYGHKELDNSMKRKLSSTGWCRICSIDCGTLEGLEMHSQTLEHQKAAMDIVLSIKKQNAKKTRNLSEQISVDEANKHTSTNLDVHGSS